MDSPQRSERLGWTGDANVMAATATWFFGLDRFYSKWERDILDAQAYNKGNMDGGMPNVAPRWAPKQGGTGGGWGDVGVNLPYVLWQRYGDTDIIRTSYVGMKKWIAYMERKSNDHIIPVKARISTAGDWENANDETPKDLIGTFYYALDVAQVAEMAAAIGEDADAAAFRKQFQEVRAAIIKAFVAPDGTVAKGLADGAGVCPLPRALPGRHAGKSFRQAAGEHQGPRRPPHDGLSGLAMAAPCSRRERPRRCRLQDSPPEDRPVVAVHGEQWPDESLGRLELLEPGRHLRPHEADIARPLGARLLR